MLNPTDSPPPSLAPRFAASITPGPPPVTTAQPRSEKRREAEVHEPHQQPAARRDAVVLLQLRMAAHLPAPPELGAGEEQDDDQDRVRAVDDEPEQREEANE